MALSIENEYEYSLYHNGFEMVQQRAGERIWRNRYNGQIIHVPSLEEITCRAHFDDSSDTTYQPKNTDRSKLDGLIAYYYKRT